MITLNRKVALVAGIIAALLAATLLTGGFASARAGSAVSAPQLLSDALEQQPESPAADPGDADVTQRLKGTTLISVYEQIENEVPLPPGGTFADINWEEIGSTSTLGAREFIEYNAACDWYRYLIAHRGNARATKEAMGVISEIARWPSFRGSDSSTVANRISTAAGSGDLKPAEQQVHVNC